MTDTTTLIQRLREDLPKVNEPESQFSCVATPDIRQAADALEQQAAQIEALQLTKAGLIGSLREEMDEGLRLRELGGALPNENITAMTERLIGERAALAAELSALRADAERWRHVQHGFAAQSVAIDGMHSWTWRGYHKIGKGANIDEAVDAALRQEQPAGEGEK